MSKESFEEEYIEATTETPVDVKCTNCEEEVYECSNGCGHIFLDSDKVFCNYDKHLCEECYIKMRRMLYQKKKPNQKVSNHE